MLAMSVATVRMLDVHQMLMPALEILLSIYSWKIDFVEWFITKLLLITISKNFSCCCSFPFSKWNVTCLLIIFIATSNLGFSFVVIILLNHGCFPPLWIQISEYSTFLIRRDIPRIAVFYRVCWGLVWYYFQIFLSPLVTIFVAPVSSYITKCCMLHIRGISTLPFYIWVYFHPIFYYIHIWWYCYIY